MQQLDGVACQYVTTFVARQLHAAASAVLGHEHAGMIGVKAAGSFPEKGAAKLVYPCSEAQGGFTEDTSMAIVSLLEACHLHANPLFEGRVRLLDALSEFHVTRNGHKG